MDKLGLLIFGAHPDDPDISAGGLAALYARHGHRVRLVSLTNGDAGHHQDGRSALEWRRWHEAQAAGMVLGAEYIVLPNHDGELEPALPVRHQVITQIREFQPDLVLAPRPWDYHPDHRATSTLVQDALYLVTVPNVVPEVPHLRQMPVAMYVADRFQKPNPFKPDVVVDIGEVVEAKVAALACHASQVFEWLPYNRRQEDEVPEGPQERLTWLRQWLEPRLRRAAQEYDNMLIELCGSDRAAQIEYAEAFEACEYGAPLTDDKLRRLFPFF